MKGRRKEGTKAFEWGRKEGRKATDATCDLARCMSVGDTRRVLLTRSTYKLTAEPIVCETKVKRSDQSTRIPSPTLILYST
jgi:hypothetical protein